MARRLGMTYANYWRLERGARIREYVEILLKSQIKEGGPEGGKGK